VVGAARGWLPRRRRDRAITFAVIAIVLTIGALIGWRYAVAHRGNGDDGLFYMALATIIGGIGWFIVVGLVVYNVWTYQHPDLALWRDKITDAAQLLR
jgi:ATP/ADP translocase